MSGAIQMRSDSGSHVPGEVQGLYRNWGAERDGGFDQSLKRQGNYRGR